MKIRYTLCIHSNIGSTNSPDKFNDTYFDHIIVDEFHHAGAASYKRLLLGFTPKFLLGLTATLNAQTKLTSSRAITTWFLKTAWSKRSTNLSSAHLLILALQISKSITKKFMAKRKI